MRRNDIVQGFPDDGNWSPYGRINRKIDDKFEVIYCTRHVLLQNASELKLCNHYKGFEDFRNNFIRMPSLRKLKQMVAGYNPEIWKKNR